MAFKIIATAHQVPTQIVTNDDLTQNLATSDEWIKSRTGIETRHIVETENTSDLCTQVAQQLLAQQNLAATKLKAIIVATMTPDYYTPATAAIVQGQLGATNAFAFDISAACSGFMYALSVARGYLQTEQDYVLVIGGEVISKVLDWSDRSTAVLFGDGAAGVLLQGTTESDCWQGERLVTLGQQSDQLTSGYLKSVPNQWQLPGSQKLTLDTFKMAGRSIYDFSTRTVPTEIEIAVLAAGLTLDQIDYFLVHQANARLIKQLAKRLSQPLSKFPMNLQHYGNTSAASIPLLFDEEIQQGRLQRGDLCLLCGFGGGLTIGIQIIRY